MRSDVELLRIVSAFGIIWFHSGYEFGRDIAYAGLVVFLILSAYFTIKSNREHSVLDRASRLLLPCFFWSIVYAVYSTLRGKEVFPDDYSLLISILSTPAIHLWYLPFVFFCTIAIDSTRKQINPAALAALVTLIASTLLLTSPLWRQWSYIPPFNQYIHAAPAIFIGVAYGVSKQLNPTLRFLLIGLLSISAIFILQFDTKGVGINYSIGIAVTLLLLREKSILPKNSAILELSKLTFGVYLLHPIILSALRYSGIESLNLVILGFVISALCIYLSLRILPQSISKYLM